MLQFLRDKFDVILVTVALIVVGATWINLGFEIKLEPYVFALFGSWLTVLGLRPRPNNNINNLTTDVVKAENIEAASTEYGDIVGTPTSSTSITKE